MTCAKVRRVLRGANITLGAALFIALLSFILLSCARTVPAVVLRPAVGSGDIKVDADSQLTALRAADAKVDAEMSFLKGDLRFIATKSWRGYLPGITEDQLV